MTPSTDNPSAAGVTQLLPCPMCGSPAKHEDYGRGRAAVSCTGCLIRTRLGCNDEDMSVEWNTRQQAITQQAEEVARLRRIVKGWADWYRLADGDPDCEYLNGMGWNDAEALADMSLAALRALNEQPGGEEG